MTVSTRSFALLKLLSTVSARLGNTSKPTRGSLSIILAAGSDKWTMWARFDLVRPAGIIQRRWSRSISDQRIPATSLYQHWWLDNLRSNINGGWQSHFGIPISLVNANGTAAGAASSGGQAAAINKEIFTAHVNLIWNPVSFADIGIEYTWGQRTVLNNQHATQNALISEFKMRF